MEQQGQNGSHDRQASLHAHIIRKQKPGNSTPPYPYSHLQRKSYRTRHLPALCREKKRTALRWQMQRAASANPTRCIGTRNALHLKGEFAAAEDKTDFGQKRNADIQKMEVAETAHKWLHAHPHNKAQEATGLFARQPLALFLSPPVLSVGRKEHKRHFNTLYIVSPDAVDAAGR